LSEFTDENISLSESSSSQQFARFLTDDDQMTDSRNGKTLFLNLRGRKHDISNKQRVRNISNAGIDLLSPRELFKKNNSNKAIKMKNVYRDLKDKVSLLKEISFSSDNSSYLSLLSFFQFHDTIILNSGVKYIESNLGNKMDFYDRNGNAAKKNSGEGDENKNKRTAYTIHAQPFLMDRFFEDGLCYSGVALQRWREVELWRV
jgi:hypothetical protein